MRKIFIIGYVWPEPTASAAGIRMLQLIRFFREQDYRVYFGSPAQRSENAFDLKKMGVSTFRIEVNNDAFDDLITGIDPDVVLFDRFMMEEQFSWRVAEKVPGALRILDTEDLHFLRSYRQKNRSSGTGTDTTALMNNSLTKREIASMYRSDLTLIISETEMEILQTVFGVPDDLLLYHPVFAEDGLVKDRELLPGYTQRKDMIFIGNFLHAPNKDAVRVLEQGLWEEIRGKLPDVNLHIYGAYMPDHYKTSNRHRKSGIVFHGRAADVDLVMRQVRVCLAPLRFGAGLKGKLIRSMENALPSVTTAVGAEGIAGDHPWGGSISPLDQGFTEAAVALYSDRQQWEKAVVNGFKIIDKRFLRGPFELKLDGRINACLLDVNRHRRSNFTGQMLMDQRNMAARYLSKYIMAKNKSKA